MGLGAFVKGVSSKTIRETDIISQIEGAVNNSKEKSSVKQGAVMCLEGLTRSLSKLFEPYVIQVLPILLTAFADSAPIVR